MPLYQFRCDKCDECRDVLVNYELAKKLELICVGCGGSMTLGPVFAVNILRSRASTANRSGSSRDVAGEAQRQGKGCGHSYHCRCAIHLTKPNPFREEIRKANGIADQD
ncbi:zinc ribbon domain-containing protein [Hyphomicrobium sp. MC1]|uniref:FmdB n=3 Tax=Pseudomonadota TaxID=1224 RepID=A0A0U2LZI5_ECOLX|nr:zinc ribbon domain-containing protein [Hyphomicrobium sp. MC1]ALS39167.1 FmdB [Escherichia coli]CBJ55920.2 putative regulatory protein [Hyphomicrobium sp. MC1]CCB65492.1 putative regulatory protein FmdB [Hyphomicrobium sp. MC1]